MQIEQKYLIRHLHDLAVEQLADQYGREGYTVQRAVPLGGTEADLVISKSDKYIIVEVKSPRNGTEGKGFRDKLLALRNFALEHPAYSLRMVVVTEPHRKKIDIKGLEEVLLSYMVDEPIEELNELATHQYIENVTGVEVNELNLLETGEVEVVGTGVVELELQYGSSSDVEKDIGYKTSDSYPFDFHVLLNHVEREGLAIKEVFALNIDLSSFYE